MPDDSAPTRPPSRWPQLLRDLGLGFLLLFLTFLFYLPALNGGLVFDDDRYLTPAHLQSLHGLRLIWTGKMGAHLQYFPVLYSGFWLEHHLWGDSTPGYHAVNLLLHIGCAWLVVAIMRKLALPGAWLAAFLFALHPLCVESVAWISELKNTLSTLFFLSSALAWLHFDRSRKWWQYLFAFALFALALLSKSSTAVLPGVLFVVAWWQRGWLDWKRDVLPLVPWLVAGCIAGLTSGSVETGAGIISYPLNFLERTLLASRIVWFYAGKVFWPSPLMFYYPLWEVSGSVWWQYLFPASLIMGGVVLCLLARRQRGPLAAFLCFIIILFPVLGFLFIDWFSFSYVADHFAYVAALAFIVPFAAWATAASRKYSTRVRRVLLIPLAMLFLVLCSLTWRESFTFRDMETLYERTLERDPGSYMAHYNYGLVLLKIPGRLSEALGEFEEAVRLHPDGVKVRDDVAYIFMTIQGGAHMQEAIAITGETLRLHPDDAKAHLLLGSALLRYPEHLQQAIDYLQAAIRLAPDSAEAHCALGSALLRQPGHLAEATGQFETAVRLDPDSMEAQYALGALLAKIPGRSNEAIGHLEAALRIMPSLDQAQVLLDQLRGQ